MLGDFSFDKATIGFISSEKILPSTSSKAVEINATGVYIVDLHETTSDDIEVPVFSEKHDFLWSQKVELEIETNLKYESHIYKYLTGQMISAQYLNAKNLAIGIVSPLPEKAQEPWEIDFFEEE